MSKLKELFTYRKNTRTLKQRWNIFAPMCISFWVLTYSPILLELCAALAVIMAILTTIYGWSYLLKIGNEAKRYGRRPIVWFGLVFLVPFWTLISYPIFAHVTKNDVIKEEEDS